MPPRWEGRPLIRTSQAPGAPANAASHTAGHNRRPQSRSAALGAIVVAPVILTTAGWTRDRFQRDWLGVGLLIGGTIAVAEVVFGESLGPILGRGPLHYVIFPFAIVAAVRWDSSSAVSALKRRC